jgi:hypothetical protein
MVGGFYGLCQEMWGYFVKKPGSPSLLTSQTRGSSLFLKCMSVTLATLDSKGVERTTEFLKDILQ